MFQVLENGKPAQYPNCKVHASWDNSIFVTRAEAEAYAIHWLGYPKGTSIPNLINNAWNYNGYGDTIEIRAV